MLFIDCCLKAAATGNSQAIVIGVIDTIVDNWVVVSEARIVAGCSVARVAVENSCLN